jgi:hypothetical protein
MCAVRRTLVAAALTILVGAAGCGSRGHPRGVYVVGSKIEDTEAPGGFGNCANFPKELAGRVWGAAGVVSVVAFPDEAAASGKRRGFAVRVINRTDDVVGFTASDSCLYLTQEALDREGNWWAIESPPEPICGNSFHRVFLDKDQYWECPAPRATGSFQTKFRFRLDLGTTQRWQPEAEEGKQGPLLAVPGGRVIYSNEFDGWVDESLLVPDRNH